MSRAASLAAAALALMLAGCATPVPQALPPTMMPKSFTGPVADSAQSWPDANWWQGFGDPAAYQNAALSAYGDVENALVQVAATARAQDHLRREIDAAREAFEISQPQYRQGAADLLTVLQAQQTLFSAEDQLVQQMLASRLAAIHLYEAMGGGWSEAAEDRTQFPEQTLARQ